MMLKNYIKHKSATTFKECVKDNNIELTSKSLHLSCKNIIDIDGIEEFTELFYIDLESNKISDISLLKNLPKLKYLFLSSNNINNIDVILELDKLESLNISNNPLDVKISNEFNIKLTDFKAFNNYEMTILKNIIKYNRRKRIIESL